MALQVRTGFVANPPIPFGATARHQRLLDAVGCGRIQLRRLLQYFRYRLGGGQALFQPVDESFVDAFGHQVIERMG
jgi:hypothetical protein